MPRTKQADAETTIPPVNDLLERRARVLEWLARLEEVEDAESRRVVERVRADYRERLQSVVEELSAHLESLREELAGARERRSRAEARHAEEDDALREVRLRHRIGEISDEEWEARRGDLEEAVTAADADRESAGEEVARLEEVLAQIEAGVLAPSHRPEAEAEAESEVGAEVDAEVEMEAQGVREQPEEAPTEPEADLAAGSTYDAEETVPEPGGIEVDQDLAFLEELDRAIAASGDAAERPEPEAEASGESVETEPEPEPRPRKGMKCIECGYTNDVTAWYCGVCGVELP